MNQYTYVLLERDHENIIIDSTDVTEEIVFLYTMIEYQERIINSYRKQVHPDIFYDQVVSH